MSSNVSLALQVLVSVTVVQSSLFADFLCHALYVTEY